MIENRAVGTNDDIHRRKHAPQGKKVFLFFCFLENLIKIYRVGRLRAQPPFTNYLEHCNFRSNYAMYIMGYILERK